MKTLDKPRGHITNDSAVPVSAGGNDELLRKRFRRTVVLRLDLVQNCVLFIASLNVSRIHFTDDGQRPFRISHSEKIDNLGASTHPSKSVDSRSQFKSDINIVDIRSNSNPLQQCLQPRITGMRKTCKPVAYDNAVFSDQRDHVGDGADRYHLEKMVNHVTATALFKKGLHQLEDNTDTGQVLVWIVAIGLLRIQNSVREGQLVRR